MAEQDTRSQNNATAKAATGPTLPIDNMREQSLKEVAPRVAISDHFATTESKFKQTFAKNARSDGQTPYDIDGDKKEDPFLHGDIIRTVLVAHGVGTAIAENLGTSQSNTVDKLKGSKASYVNCSFGYYCSYELLSAVTDIKITPENIAEKKKEILHSLEELTKGGEDNSNLFNIRCMGLGQREAKEKGLGEKEGNLLMLKYLQQFDSVKEVVRNIKEYEKAAADGGPIPVVAAGNLGPGQINLFALGSGFITVGGTDKDGKPHPDSGTALVTHWAPYETAVKATKTGLDINSDGITDIPWSKTSSKGQGIKEGTVVHTIKGTSTAAPIVAAELAKKKFQAP